MAEKQFLFFDLGWTLEDETDSQIDRAKKAAVALKSFSIETSYQDILLLQKKGAKEFAEEVFPFALESFGLNECQIKEVMEFSKWDKTQLHLYADAIAVLNHLKPWCFLGIIANQSAGTFEGLKKYGILDIFDLVFASAELGLSKPDPEIFRKAQEISGCSSKNAWMIGDRIDNDIRPAKFVGWNTIRILNGYNRFQNSFDELDIADFTIEILSEIPEIVEKTKPLNRMTY